MNAAALHYAVEVRFAIEGGCDADVIAPQVLNLVDALGGRRDVFRDAVSAGKHSMAMTYLVTLLMTQD